MTEEVEEEKEEGGWSVLRTAAFVCSEPESRHPPSLPPSLPRQPSPSPQDLKIAADYQQSGDDDSDPDRLRNLHPKRTANG